MKGYDPRQEKRGYGSAAWEVRTHGISPANKERKDALAQRMAAEAVADEASSNVSEGDSTPSPSLTDFLHEPQINARRNPAEAHAAAQARRALHEQRFGHSVVRLSEQV